jgi:hypothetical protein
LFRVELRLLAAALDAELLFERGLRRCQPRREQAEGRAGDVVEVDFVAELDGLWIAAMLAANADFEVGPRIAPFGYGHLHQLPHASLIEGGEGILLEDAKLEIGRQEVVDVVARDAVGGLRQVVGAEREELGFLGDLIGGKGAAGISIIVPTL